MLSKYGTVYFYWDISDTVDDIIGNDNQKERMRDFFGALKNYILFAKKLKDTKLAPNLTMLLYGPPGTGKTSLARAFSKEYEFHICVVESDKLVTSLLGETIKSFRKVIDDAAHIVEKNEEPLILFFDEIDAVGSERSNVHEVGEIKRAVISFLQAIDSVSKKNLQLAILGATNHQQQLDSAIWRRFTFHLEFGFPNIELRLGIIKSFLNRIINADIKVDELIFKKLNDEYEYYELIANRLGLKLSDDNLIKEMLNTNEKLGLLTLTKGYSGSDIERGTRVALFKAIGAYPRVESLNYEMYYDSLKLVGGTEIHVDRQGVLSETDSTVSKDIIETKLKINNYEELLKELPNLNPIIKEIFNIINKKEDLKTDYLTGNKDLGEFINILIEISKVLKNKNILKYN